MRPKFPLPIVLLLSALAPACGGVGANSDGGSGELQLFIATESSFEGFDKWQSYSFDSPGTPDGLTHVAGHRIVYINKLPAHGATEFAVGTVIVKKIIPDDGTTTNARTFAMAKRGGDYNSSGAAGWEWLELDPPQTINPAMPNILWRGVAPPAGENYSGSPSGTCNDCHSAAKANDYVQSPPLQFDKL